MAAELRFVAVASFDFLFALSLLVNFRDIYGNGLSIGEQL